MLTQMSKLSEALNALAPLSRSENWNDGHWAGPNDVREIVAGAMDDMREVDAMMNEIARATSQPVSLDERVQRAVDLAAIELRGVDPGRWPGMIVDLLDRAGADVSDAQYTAILGALAKRIATRLAGGRG
jgi:hypothetical protein